MIFEWIGFSWLIIMIIYYTLKWFKEKRRISKFKVRMKSYDKKSMTMNISERLKYKRRTIKKQ